MRKKRIFRAILSGLCAVSLLLQPAGVLASESEEYVSDIVVNSPAAEQKFTQPSFDVPAKTAILMEASTGRILYKKAENEKMPPASITKIMTLLLVMERIDQGTLKLTDKVTASKHACSMGGSQIWLKENEQMTVDELLRATAIASANDAAVALGEHLAGSEEAFVNLMNMKAKELGMKNTVFKNASGLDTDGHLSSAYDIALMSRALLSHELIEKYSTVWMDSLRDGKTSLVNTNKLVRFYDGCTGLKTGTTDGAGSCLSASAKRGGVQYIAVVMGAKTSDERFASARTLLDYAFNTYTLYTPKVDTTKIGPVKVLRGMQQQVKVKAELPSGVLIQKGKEKNIEQKISLVTDVMAPVEKGQVIGKLTILLDGQILGEYNIKAESSVEKMNFSYALKLLLYSLLS